MKPLLLLLLLSASSPAQGPSFESAPTLKAAGILKPEILSGPNHQVLPTVSTFQGRNHYTIETPYGYFQADGDAMLLARVAEANAIAELQNVSRNKEFQDSLKSAAKAPLEAVGGLIDNPAETGKKVAKGLWKFANRAKETVKNVATGQERPQGQEGIGRDLIGFSKAKRQLALQLGVDPYSSNEIFQEELAKVAWVKTAGTGVFKIATLPIGGGVGIALGAADATQTFQESLRDLSPADLQAANRKKLLAMGVAADIVESFLGNPAFRPTQQTVFVQALQALAGVKNRTALVMCAADTATEEGDALFCSGSAQLLAALHAGRVKLSEITMLGGFPVAISSDGRLILALQWDTAFWSERAQEFIDAAAVAKLGQTGPMVVAITGNATNTMTAELEKRGILIITRALDGPQK